MKNFIKIILLLLTLNLFTLNAKELPKIVTVNEIIENVSKKFDNIKSMVCGINIKTSIGKVEKIMKGELKYRAPDEFIIFFESPKEQFIYTDGKVLKIFIPELNILGEQRLESLYRERFFVSGKSSFYYLKTKYNFSFAKSNKPELINNVPYYVLLLEPKERVAEFKKIKLYISLNWLIVKSEAEAFNGNKTEISFNDIYLNKKLTDYEFEFNLPVNVQTVVNPFTFSEIK